MSAFNELITTENSKLPENWRERIQFRFGDVRQYIYEVGDRLIGISEENPEMLTARVLGVSIGGDSKQDLQYFIINIRNGIIDSYRMISVESEDYRELINKI